MWVEECQHTQVDITEAAAADLAADAVLVPHAEVLLSCQYMLIVSSCRVPSYSRIAEVVSGVEGQAGWTYHCRHVLRLTSAVRISVVCTLNVC